ncbi:hypothetical protein Agub_g10731, partial [Astrephomene gubernaculifera]
MQEVERVAALLRELPPEPAGGPERIIGLRINPQVGEGRIAALSTAGRVSKFGVPLGEARSEVLTAFARHPWLNALHLHVGSQGVPLELTVEGVARVWELAQEIEATCSSGSSGSGGSLSSSANNADGAGSSSLQEDAADVADGLPSVQSLSEVAVGQQQRQQQQQQRQQPGRRRLLAFDIGGGLPVQYGSDDLGWLLGADGAAREGLATVVAEAQGGQKPVSEAASAGGTGAAAVAAAAGEMEAGCSVFERYVTLLRRRLPDLFASGQSVCCRAGNASNGAVDDGEADVNTPPPLLQPPLLPPLPPPQLVTEFGRCLVAKSAFAAGRVEYVKECGGRRVVVSGLGGDLLVRAVYLPDTWPVRVELCGPMGHLKHPHADPAAAAPCSLPQQQQLQQNPQGDAHEQAERSALSTPSSTTALPLPSSTAAATTAAGEADADAGPSAMAPTDVVGPLCFQGDRLAEAVSLPPVAPGDWVVVPDVGAYCLSMYSRYNSRCSPPVLGF